MNDDFRILDELIVGDKRRRLEHLTGVVNSMKSDDPGMLPIMLEVNQLHREIFEFMNLYSQNSQ